MSENAFIRTPDDSVNTGKAIRNLRITAIVDNVPTIVHMQVTQIADENGNPISLVDQADFQRNMLDETRAIRLALQYIANAGDVMAPDFFAKAQTIREDLVTTED